MPCPPNCGMACLVPLQTQFGIYGLMIVASSQENAYTQEHLTILSALVRYTIIAQPLAALTPQHHLRLGL